MKTERTKVQNLLLLILAAMILLFGVLSVVSLCRKGVTFEGTLLRIQTEEDCTVYSGKVYGDPVSVTVRPAEMQVEYAAGDVIRDVYTVEYPLESIQTQFGSVPGIRILKNDSILFEGGYDPRQEFAPWVDQKGEWDVEIHVTYESTGGLRAPEELTRGNVMYFLNGPDIVHRGSIGLYLLMVLLTLILMVDVACPLVLFKLQHMLDVRDPEPTEFYLAMQRVGWLLYPCLLLAGYILSLTVMP